MRGSMAAQTTPPTSPALRELPRPGMRERPPMQALLGTIAPDDVADLEHLWLAQVYPDLNENRHETVVSARCVEMLRRLPAFG